MPGVVMTPAETTRNALLRQAAGHLRGDPWPGFAGIHADQDGGIRRPVAQVGAQRQAEGMYGRGVQRILSRHAANTICSE